MRKRFWELGGSRIGDAMGIARPVEEEATAMGAMAVGGQGLEGEEENDEDNVDYREGSSFGKHMKNIKMEVSSPLLTSPVLS